MCAGRAEEEDDGWKSLRLGGGMLVFVHVNVCLCFHEVAGTT